MKTNRILLAALAALALASCQTEVFPTQEIKIDFEKPAVAPADIDKWPRTVFVFDKNNCVDVRNFDNASDVVGIKAGRGYKVVMIAYSSRDNVNVTPAAAGSEAFRYKVMAADSSMPLPEMWYGSAVSHGGGEKLEMELHPVTAIINLDVKNIPAGMDSITFDLPVCYDVWYPCEQKAEVSIPGEKHTHICLETAGKSEISLSIGTMAMINSDKKCMVPVNCYYEKEYSEGYLPFNRRIEMSQVFDIRLDGLSEGEFFDSPFKVSYELSNLEGELLADGEDYLSQWKYSRTAPELPSDTTAFYVRNGRRMLAGRSFAFQFGSNMFGFDDSWVNFHSWGYLDDVDIYAKAGFDHIRIPVDEGCCCFSTTGELKPDMKIELKKLVDACIKAGMRVIIDHHWMASGLTVMPSETQSYDVRPSEQEIRFRNTWRQLHEMFKDYAPEDLAYEIVNEAYTGTGYDWNTFIDRAIRMMRGWGGNELRRVIVCPCESEGDDGVHFLEKLVLPKNDPNLIATFHDYSPVWFCFYKTGFQGGASHFDRYGGPVHYPGRIVTDAELADMQVNHPDWYESTMYFRYEVYDKNYLYEEFVPARDARLKLGVPVWLGEYGSGSAAPYPDRLRYFQDVCSVLRGFGISYSYWFNINKSSGDNFPDPDIVRAMIPSEEQ